MKIVYTASSEAEALMMQQILTNNQVKSQLRLSPEGLSNLKGRMGGATFPNETWEVLVSDADELKSKELLPGT